MDSESGILGRKAAVDEIMKSMTTVGGSIVAALLTLAVVGPKLLNMFKGDSLNGSVLDRLKAMEEHAKVQDRRAIVQDDKIHRFAVKVTKLVVVMIRLEGLLQHHEIEIPQDLIDDMVELRKDDIEDLPEMPK
jgi:hypothetical protein